MLNLGSPSRRKAQSRPLMSMAPSAVDMRGRAMIFARLFWPASNRRISALLLAAAVTGCTLTPDTYISDTVHGAPDAEVAIVEGKSAWPCSIDRKSLDHPNSDKFYASARVAPGKHSLTLCREFVVSVMIVPGGFYKATRSYDVNLEAGHVYELHADRTTGQGFRVAMWIRDATTGTIVAGQELTRN